ncbi:acyl-CoA synthetase [Nonomuraea candida]|uniref:acyl-CoA synthetase n=1 Tax=Nonomuraea candida TaxID=359159 RepID=UPI001FDF121D|nr:long-chain fatty acid--CoA ligase [Nonomuraea candida]
MRNQGIGSWPARRARKTPGRVAVTHDGRHVTYREMHERVVRLAHVLRDRGVGRGDRVAYLGPNHPAFLETLFAAGVLGAVFVPLNTRLAGPEQAHVLADSGTAVLVHAAATDLDVPCRISLAEYEGLLAGAGSGPIDERVAPGDACMIMYTSGTTGRPKGAVLSHANLTWNSVNVLVDIDLTADEVTLVVAPLFHTAGLNMTCLPTLLKGGRVVLQGAFDPGRVLEAVEAERVTHLFGVPTMFDAISAHPRWTAADLSSLRTLNCGGAPVPMRTIETYLARGLAFSQGYGMTEASPGVLYLPADQAVAKAGSAGVPHFFTDVRVVLPDGRDAAPGENGEVLVQGPNVMTGYWGLPPAAPDERPRTGDMGLRTEEVGPHAGDVGLRTEEVGPRAGDVGLRTEEVGLRTEEVGPRAGDVGLRTEEVGPRTEEIELRTEDAWLRTGDVWLRTGDVARTDEDGYAYIVGRIKDMYVSGGENVYPAEVEEALASHPAVAECAVIGVPDATWGEVGRAVVVLRPGATADAGDLLGFLRGRLAKYKIPKSVVWAESLPRTPSGKIAKLDLHAAHADTTPTA